MSNFKPFFQKPLKNGTVPSASKILSLFDGLEQQIELLETQVINKLVVFLIFVISLQTQNLWYCWEQLLSKMTEIPFFEGNTDWATLSGIYSQYILRGDLV